MKLPVPLVVFVSPAIDHAIRYAGSILKRAVPCVALVFLPLLDVHSQGLVAFNNRDTANGVNAPAYDTDGVTKLDGNSPQNFHAALYGAPGAGAAESSLVMLANPFDGLTVVGFRTGAAAGYVNVGSSVARAIPGAPYGSLVSVQVRYWAGASTTYEQALATGAKTGKSNLLTVPTTTNSSDPNLPALVGLSLVVPIDFLIAVPPGYSIFANQLINTNNTIPELFRPVPDGTRILKWTGTGYAMNQYDAEFREWLDPSQRLGFGEAAFIFNPTSNNLLLYFYGTVLHGPFTNTIPHGYSLQCWPQPQSFVPTNFASLADKILVWPPPGPFQTYTYDPVLGWDTPPPTIGRAQGFFVERTSAGAAQWVISLP